MRTMMNVFQNFYSAISEANFLPPLPWTAAKVVLLITSSKLL